MGRATPRGWSALCMAGPVRCARSRSQRLWILAGVLALVVCVASGAVSPVRTLVVGSEQQFPPFAIGMTDATADGFTVELWREVAKEEGLAYAIRVRPFDELLLGFKSGSVH